MTLEVDGGSDRLLSVDVSLGSEIFGSEDSVVDGSVVDGSVVGASVVGSSTVGASVVGASVVGPAVVVSTGTLPPDDPDEDRLRLVRLLLVPPTTPLVKITFLFPFSAEKA